MFEIPVLLSLIKPPAWKKCTFSQLYIGRSPSLVQYTNKSTTYCSVCKWNDNNFLSWKQNHGILFLYILVIVCANLTSNAIIFKRIADMSLVIDFCNDYRTYLGWQVSSILFSIIISSFDFNLFKSLISRNKKQKTLHHQPPCVRLMFDTIGQHISLAKRTCM